MLDVLKFMNVKQRIIYKTMIFIFKIKMKILPSYLYDNFDILMTFMHISFAIIEIFI